MPAPLGRPGHLAKRGNDYLRLGTANLFAVVEAKAERHLTGATPNRTAGQSAQVMRDLVAAYPAAQTIRLVMDNPNALCCNSVTDHPGQRLVRALWRRLTVHHRRRKPQPVIAQADPARHAVSKTGSGRS